MRASRSLTLTWSSRPPMTPPTSRCYELKGRSTKIVMVAFDRLTSTGATCDASRCLQYQSDLRAAHGRVGHERHIEQIQGGTPLKPSQARAQLQPTAPLSI